jgi:hypothetical protein
MQIYALDGHAKLQGLRKYGPSHQSIAVYSATSIQLHLSNHSPLFYKLGTPNPEDNMLQYIQSQYRGY